MGGGYRGLVYGNPYTRRRAHRSAPLTNMKLLITGANGFLGTHVVGEALRRGHDVRAVVRPSTDVAKLTWSTSQRVEVARVDLRTREGLTDIVRGVDCVVHLAAVKTGDVHAQYHGTVITTENLLNAMNEAGVRRLVAVSSFSVYDFMKASPSMALDEHSPLEKDGLQRDIYTQTKLVQEQLIREHSSKNGFDLVVLRPGMIWGKNNLLNAWVGFGLGGRIWVRTGARAHIPATYVENCAEAIVMSADCGAAWGHTFNIVDDALPTQREFLRMALAGLTSKPTVFPVSYALLRFAARVADFVNRNLLRSRARIPGILVPCRLHARAKPLIYSNRKLKDATGWMPRYSLVEGFERSFSLESKDIDLSITHPPSSALEVSS